jgi:hypothetical protein
MMPQLWGKIININISMEDGMKHEKARASSQMQH